MTLPSNQSGKLKVHEWFAISTMVTIVIALALISSLYERQNKKTSFNIRKDSLEILIKGAVTHPGVYHLPSPLPMKALLALAEPLPDANLRRYNMEKIVTKGRVLNIPERRFIHVHIEGAVKQPLDLKVPKGTRLEELIDKVELSENADKKALQRKRKLKPNETIVIPSKS